MTIKLGTDKIETDLIKANLRKSEYITLEPKADKMTIKKVELKNNLSINFK